MERHPRGALLSEIDVFEGYKNKGLLLQTVSLFVHFKQIPLEKWTSMKKITCFTALRLCVRKR